MNSKHGKTLQSIFAKPTQGSIKLGDIEALVVALGGVVREGEGSRVALQLNVSAPPTATLSPDSNFIKLATFITRRDKYENGNGILGGPCRCGQA